jgi:HTH-type transcriptional regulator / antitoxin HigA
VETSWPEKVFHPGEFVKRELDARGWTQVELAAIIQRPVQLVNEIVAGKRGVTPETAKALGQAFGIPPETLMKIETAYQLAQTKDDPGIALRARIYSAGPIKELIKRGWVRQTDDPEELLESVLAFYERDQLEGSSVFYPHAARKATSYSSVNQSQIAWLYGAKHAAERVHPSRKYTSDVVEPTLETLGALLDDPNDLVKLPSVLGDAGIRFVVVEALPQTRIDGACFWLDVSSPVIAVTLRFDRIDYFWHTLTHELGHVLRGDGLEQDTFRLDTDMVGGNTAPASDRPAYEAEVDDFASRALVPAADLESFIRTTRPFYSRAKIVAFARTVRVHPGIVVGQLQYRGEIQYSHSRDLLVKVRDLITSTAQTDGWGRMLEAQRA